MMSASMMAAAGHRRSAGPPPNYLDHFAAVVRTGDATYPEVIDGDVNMTGGGYIHTKNRGAGVGHNILMEDLAGPTKYVVTLVAGTPTVVTNISLTADGFDLSSGTGYVANASGANYVDWIFKKLAGFMDQQNHTGNTTNRTVSHSLAAGVGMAIGKSLTGSGNIYVFHKDMDATPANSANHWIGMNSSSGRTSSAGVWNTVPSSTVYGLGTGAMNNAGEVYEVTLFAHDPSSSGRSICGVWTGNGSSSGPSFVVPWDFRYMMCKRADGTGDWSFFDATRSASWTPPQAYLQQGTAAELSGNIFTYNSGTKTVQITSTDGDFNTSGGRYIYLIVR